MRFSWFSAPLINTQGDWDKIQNIWDRWQGLNVGMLAFISSLVALNISTYNADQQRKREFTAARAFLPQALSELHDYCEECMQVLHEFWDARDANNECNQSIDHALPKLPQNYREVFEKCIRYAAPEVGDWLARILSKLQVHEARLKSLYSEAPNESAIINADNINAYLYGILKIQILINRTFKFARNEGPLDKSPQRLDEYENALRIAGLYLNQFDRLNDFIATAIERGKTI
ncbi:MAG: hypothetical protein PVF65_11530 [Sphingomonadales bacterium]|jgi:hypothetical protein